MRKHRGNADYNVRCVRRKQELVLGAVRRYAKGMLKAIAIWLVLFLARILRGLAWMTWVIFRPAVRFVSAVLLLAAVIALTADVTRWQVGDTDPTFHSLAHHVQTVAPATFQNMQKSISTTLHPVFWDYGLYIILSLPAWLLFAIVSLLIVFAGREPKRINVFIN